MLNTNYIFHDLVGPQIFYSVTASAFIKETFPAGTAHVFFAVYVLLFSIVIMNLLIGLAVSDIRALMEIARRESIISQINMINEMMDRRTTFVYKYCIPQCIKKLFEG